MGTSVANGREGGQGAHERQRLAISASLAKAIALSGVSAAGLLTTAQPTASAGAIFRASIEFGKFHGVIVATTPTGCFITRIRLSSWWPGMMSP